MNKTYRVVWNEHTNTWTVLQETAKARGKSGNRISKALALSVSLFGFYAASSTVAYAQPGIYMNDYQDTGCAASYDQVEKTGVYGLLGNMPPSTETYNNGQANKTHHSDFGIKTGFNPCSPTGNSAQNFDTQTNRTLFYGDATFGYAIDEKNAGSKHLTLGGRLDVNSGIIGVGNKGVNGVGATNSIRMGSGTSLDATNDADKAITIGVDSGATAKNATAIGHGTKAGGQNAFAAGLDTHADNENTVAIGTNANASGKTSTAIGQGAKASHQSATALGDGAKALNDYATALGVTANASEAGALAVGMTSAASAWNSAAIGSNASASGSTSLAAGYKASAGSSNSLAVGSSAKATATDASAYGHIATAKGISASAFGHGANAEKDHTVAVGSAAQATELGAIAIGNDAQATAIDALANGKNSRALGERATAVGNSARANNQDSVAVGNGARASADYAFAAGTGSVAKAAGAVALGNDAKANHEGAVALGRASETAAAVGTSSATVNGISYSGFAGDAPDSTVSVGSDSLKRTVTNVAAGRINATSTDAINGSQLYLTQAAIGNVGTTIKNILGGNAALGTDGKLSMTNIGGTGKNTIHEAIQAANNNANAANAGFTITADDDAAGITADNKTIKPSETLTIKGTGSLNAGKSFADDYNSDNIRTQVSGDGTITVGLKRDLDVNSVTATDAAGNKTVTNAAGTTVTNAAGNSTSVGANGVVITPPAGSGKNAVALTGNGLNNGNNTITGVKNGVAPTDAVNVSQLDAVKTMAKAAKTEVTSSDNSISITPSANAATGATVYDLAVKTDGTTITKAADGSLKANTTALTPSANGSIVAPTAADAGKLATAGDIANAINQAGFNLTTTASAGSVSGSSVSRVNAGKTVTIDAGKNIRVTQTGNTVSIATQDNASFDSVTTGNTKIDNNGLTINGGPSVTQSGIDAAGNKITNVAAGTDPTDAVNVSQLNARLGATGQAAEEKLKQLENKLDQNQDRANAGIAGAIAQGTIPQVTRPSAFGLGVGTGYYGGQSALAVGASAMTDGGNWIFKGNVSVNSKGRVGAGAGALFQW